MLCILCFDGIRLIIGDLCVLIELILRLLIECMMQLFIIVVIANVLDLHFLLNLWSVAMRLGLRHVGFDGVTHVELAF
jgi:Cdc6-like AAA superfamily ATPase